MTVAKRCSCTETCACKYHYKFEHEGRRYRGTTHTANYQLARQVAQKKYNAVVGLTHGVQSHAPIKARLSELTLRYGLFAEGAHAAPHRTKARIARFVALMFGKDDPPIVSIESFVFERFRHQLLKQGLDRGTVQTEYAAVKGMFREAATWYPGYVRPDAKVELWELPESEIVLLSDEELHLTLTRLPPFFARLCRVTLETLARLDEVLGLTLHDLGPNYLLRRLKGGGRLRAAITPALSTELRATMLPGQPWLFGARMTRGPRRGTIGRVSQPCASGTLRYQLDALGFPHIHHHLYRHVGVTQMLDNGVNVRTIQKLAGWTNLRMLERYGHVRDAEMRRAVDGNAAAVAKWLAGEPVREALAPLSEKSHGHKNGHTPEGAIQQA